MLGLFSYIALINQIISVMGKNGGARPGSGRKPKADEIKLADSIRNVIGDEELLGSIAAIAQDPFHRDQLKALGLLAGYLYGKPLQRIESKEVEELPEIHFVRAKTKGKN